jgi:hypothetical protein
VYRLPHLPCPAGLSCCLLRHFAWICAPASAARFSPLLTRHMPSVLCTLFITDDTTRRTAVRGETGLAAPTGGGLFSRRRSTTCRTGPAALAFPGDLMGVLGAAALAEAGGGGFLASGLRLLPARGAAGAGRGVGRTGLQLLARSSSEDDSTQSRPGKGREGRGAEDIWACRLCLSRQDAQFMQATGVYL